MNHGKLAIPVAAILLISGLSAAQPMEVPPGHMTGEAVKGPAWMNDMMGSQVDTWRIVGISVAATLAVLAAVYWFHFRDRETVKVETDQEKALKIIEESGGKMKQPELGEETGWSASKVSRVTDRLEDEGEIDKLRMGRENVLRVPEEN
ncbi:MAG: helix-turn-helix transcriptional regulator [Candidatus Nanohaloarchaea archaeon]